MKETLLHRIKDGLRDMCYIWAKEMRQTITDEGVLIFFLLVPFLYPLLYSWAYSGEMVREVPVAIVDNSHSHQSRHPSNYPLPWNLFLIFVIFIVIMAVKTQCH